MRLKFVILSIFMLMALPTFAAKSVKVSALSEFNSLEPAKEMKVMVLEHTEFNNGIIFEDGTIVYGNVLDVKQPKRGKMNATFKFKPTSYLYKGKLTEIEDSDFIAKYKAYKELDKVKIATSTATTVGGIVFQVPLLSQAVSFIKGSVKNNEDNRIKSGAIQVYKDSPLSYIEEGKDLVITKDTIFLLKFKSTPTENLDEETINETTHQEEMYTNNKTTLENQINNEQAVNSISIENPYQVLDEVEAATKNN